MNVPRSARPYQLQAELDGYQVYYKAEVEEFCRIFYTPKPCQTAADHARMNACIDPVVRRYTDLDDHVRPDYFPDTPTRDKSVTF